MVNRPKIKGTLAETAVVGYLRRRGAVNAERRALSGGLDKGDVAGIVSVCIEVKNEQKLNLAGWLAEMLAEKINSAADVGLVWAKRRGKADPADWYVIMDGAQAVDLLIAAGYIPDAEPQDVSGVVTYGKGA